MALLCGNLAVRLSALQRLQHALQVVANFQAQATCPCSASRAITSVVPFVPNDEKELVASDVTPITSSFAAPFKTAEEAKQLLADLRRRQPNLLQIMFADPWTNRRYYELKRDLAPRVYEWLLQQSAPASVFEVVERFNAAQGPGAARLPDEAFAAELLQELEDNRHVRSELVAAPPALVPADWSRKEEPPRIKVYVAHLFQQPFHGTPEEHAAWLADAKKQSMKRARERVSVGKLPLPKVKRHAATSSFEVLAARVGLEPAVPANCPRTSCLRLPPTRVRGLQPVCSALALLAGCLARARPAVGRSLLTAQCAPLLGATTSFPALHSRVPANPSFAPPRLPLLSLLQSPSCRL